MALIRTYQTLGGVTIRYADPSPDLPAFAQGPPLEVSESLERRAFNSVRLGRRLNSEPTRQDTSANPPVRAREPNSDRLLRGSLH